QHRLALDEPPLTALGQRDEPGGPVPPLLGDVLRPALGRRLEVPVGGDHLVVARHGRPLHSARTRLALGSHSARPAARRSPRPRRPPTCSSSPRRPPTTTGPSATCRCPSSTRCGSAP